MRLRSASALSFALLISLSPLMHAQNAAQKKLKVYISVDMEGVAGVVTADQLHPGGFEYERFRQFMTNETLAAVRAAKDAGASEVLVSDSHGNGENLLIEQFPKDVRIIRSWPRRLGMMAGIDASFDAALFIGYHASTNNPRGVRAHTFERTSHARDAERHGGYRGRVQCRDRGCVWRSSDFCLGRRRRGGGDQIAGRRD